MVPSDRLPNFRLPNFRLLNFGFFPAQAKPTPCPGTESFGGRLAVRIKGLFQLRPALIIRIIFLGLCLLLTPAPQAQAKISALQQAKTALLSVSPEDLDDGYQAQLERAMILAFQATYEVPFDPEVWRFLGRLMEIRSIFAADSFERRELLEDASTHFAHSEELERERLRQDQKKTDPKAPGADNSSYSDPYLSELTWAARLRRGEVTLEELQRRYSAENLEAAHQPQFWSDRLHVIARQLDPGARAAELTKAREDFAYLWANMPVEVPWRSQVNKFGPPKLKKIEVLEAWAETLAALSAAPLDPEDRKTLFLEALALYPLATKLPLDRHELAILISGLDRHEALTPDNDCLIELWNLKDQLYNHWLAVANQDPAIWAAWGQEYLRRADRQFDDRIFESYLQQAQQKFLRYTELHSQPAAAFREWGEQLENMTFAARVLLENSEASQRLGRIQSLLTQALEKYRQAYALEPEHLPHLQSLSRILLKIAALKDRQSYQEVFDESTALAFMAISRDPDTPGAWLKRGFECLEAMDIAPVDPDVRQRLTSEAFAAFHQYLRANLPRTDHLISAADRVWAAAQQSPSHQVAGLSLLADICNRLISLDPKSPDYHFALGLTLYSLLAANPNWPDDLEFSAKIESRQKFDDVLASYLRGLELLSSLGRPTPSEIAESGQNSPDKPSRWSFPPPEGLLSGDIPKGAMLAAATFQERLASTLNRELVRLINALNPSALPPWYKIRLAGLFRRLASSGYPPLEDQMAFFRFALSLLDQAETEFSTIEPQIAELTLEAMTDLRPGGPLPSDTALTLADKGLVLAEMSLMAADKAPFLVDRAQKLWSRAEADSPGSSQYARARWAAWSGNEAQISPLLAHTPLQQDNLLWPTYGQAAFEPAFKRIYDQSWFKSAWFGYGQ